MPKKGYKQSKEHIQRVIAGKKKSKGKDKQAENVYVGKNAFRNITCQNYDICLQNAAYFDLTLDCENCPNYQPEPEPEKSELYYYIGYEQALRCCLLLTAVFYPDIYKHRHETRKQYEDAPLADVKWF
ncbi:MAG: hypothetical protein U5R49_21990 [Deltaproteobacteria bacterium]|nr:hypothetical protein [Deltaproteobacteria bacterium]